MRMSFTQVVGGWVSLPTLDRGDHLHPNETGQRAMGNAIDLDPF
jgi:lysophospholipase L1-like esterase